MCDMTINAQPMLTCHATLSIEVGTKPGWRQPPTNMSNHTSTHIQQGGAGPENIHLISVLQDVNM